MRNKLIGILIISVLSPTAHAAAPTVLTACGVLGLPGSYILANDVAAPASGACFLVMADVNLNMDGHSITPGAITPMTPRIGVRVTSTGAGSRIHDGSITSLRDAASGVVGTGIRIEGASAVRVTGMTITGNNFGVFIIGANDNRFDGNNVSSNSEFGFQVDAHSDNNSFVGNQCDQNGSSGGGGCIFLALNTGNSVTSNTMNNNTVDGVILGGGATGNEIRNNVINGGGRGVTLAVANGNTVRSNTITGAGSGIVLFLTVSANTISNNIVSGSTSFDIFDAGAACDDTFKNNTFSTSSGPAGCIQ